jgi:hypothetical protein
MGQPANFPTRCGASVFTQPGVPGATIVSIDQFGIFPLLNAIQSPLVQQPILQVNDVIFEIRFTPFANNTDPFFFVQIVTPGSVTILSGFELHDSIGGIIEIDFFDISINQFRTFSLFIFFDFTLPASGSPLNPNHLPGSWVTQI